MANILAPAPRRPEESEHCPKTFWVGQLPNDIAVISRRLGVNGVQQGYGMTEGYPNQMVSASGYADKAANCIGEPT